MTGDGQPPTRTVEAEASPSVRHRVILVREWDSQHTGSGCCGNLGGKHAEIGDGRDFAHCRARMEGMGAVYRALRSEFGDRIEIEIVDPRNTAWLVPAIWRDARRHGAGVMDAFRALRAGTANGAIVCDGRVLSTGEPPLPDDAVDAVLDALAGR